jgi:hypothetical protein
MKIISRVFWWGILPLILLVAGALYYISVRFATLEFDDNFPASGNYASLFPDSYEQARNDFQLMSKDLSEIYQNVVLSSYHVPSQVDYDLTVDVCFVPAQKDSANLLILSSGVHGAEGFVGTAVQKFFIQKYLTEELLENTGVLLIHAVNPYGYKYTRRVTENNVDLNRNSPSVPGLYEIQNEGYPQVYDLINPEGMVDTRSMSNRFFFLRAINEIRKASMPVLRQAVLQGQYQFAEGLYFGGMSPEPQIEALKPIIEEVIAPYEKVLAIDLHTGYGERGKLHFFPNPLAPEERLKMEKLFDGFAIDWGDSDDFYTVTGDFVGFMAALHPEKEFYPMLFEYGTLNSQTTMGSLKSIHIMILENQGQQHGYMSKEDSIQVKADLLEMYYPESENWQNFIMDQTENVFSIIIPRFAE